MGSDRRSILRLAAGALVFSALPARAAAGASFSPPAGPMRYTRRLDRVLSGSARLTVSRSFGVHFAPTSQGYRVDGEPVGIEVSGPPALDVIMRMEKERKELGLFPLLLDARGLIVGLDGPGEVSPIDEAVREVSARLARQLFDPLERAQLNQFVNALHQSAGRLMALLPDDLFAPSDTSRTESRKVVLPGGATGIVTVTFNATRDPETGLMREARRQVVTRLAEETRETIESWHLDRNIEIGGGTLPLARD